MATWSTVFSDDFPAAPDVDRSKWGSPQWQPKNNPAYIGRTGIRNPHDFTGEYEELGLIPCTAQNGADLRFSTYNPLAQPANSAFSVQISSRSIPGEETVKRSSSRRKSSPPPCQAAR